MGASCFELFGARARRPKSRNRYQHQVVPTLGAGPRLISALRLVGRCARGAIGAPGTQVRRDRRHTRTAAHVNATCSKEGCRVIQRNGTQSLGFLVLRLLDRSVRERSLWASLGGCECALVFGFFKEGTSCEVTPTLRPLTRPLASSRRADGWFNYAALVASPPIMCSLLLPVFPELRRSGSSSRSRKGFRSARRASRSLGILQWYSPGRWIARQRVEFLVFLSECYPKSARARSA